MTTKIEFTSSSTLTAARALSRTHPNVNTPSSSSGLPSTKVGVLLSASPKKPKGAASHGGVEQLDLLIRSTSLISIFVDSVAGKNFFEEHKKYWKEDGSGLHDHGMLYSPGVVAFRQDVDGDDDHVVSPSSDTFGADVMHIRRRLEAGAFICPYTINVLSAVPVSASVVRSKHMILPEDEKLFADGIRGAMKERMARALKVFEERGNKAIVLGAFGCGCSSQNSVETVASIWAELLFCGSGQEGARFRDVFEKVVFAVSGKQFAPFKRAFEMRIFEEEFTNAVV